ncbi:endonuclease III [Candidatus Sumerlaeota bacterium]|nr:endonuclease III [Candidatus Sumerlaeota bacterium]
MAGGSVRTKAKILKREKPQAEAPAELKKRALRISNTLRKIYGAKGTALHFVDPFQLLVATILSAQCTDDQVNRTTPGLFAAYPDALMMGKAKPEAIEKLIHSTGFFRQKTKSILAVAKEITEKFGGRVPETMEELTSLPGVGRKTANLVRAMAFGHPGIIVDTHFRRLAQRLGLADTDDPTKIEFRIAELLPSAHWTEFSNSLIWHGRAICNARKPNCPECPVLKNCPFGQSQMNCKL